MNYIIGQKVYVTLAPSLMGFTIGKAFQLVEGAYVGGIGDLILVKIGFKDAPFKETVLNLNRENIFTNLKDAIDAAYDKYSKVDEDAVDNRPT